MEHAWWYGALPWLAWTVICYGIVLILANNYWKRGDIFRFKHKDNE